MDRSRAIGLFLAIPVILVWGITFVATKALLRDFSALEILFIRYGAAYLVLWAMCPRRLRVPSHREEVEYLLAGLFGVTVYQFLENAAIHYTTATNVSILVSICPVFTAALSQLVLREKALTRRFLLGFVLALVGVTMVCLNGVLEVHLNPLGDLMALGAAVSWACYSTLLSRINARNPDLLASTRRIFFWSLLFMLPLLVYGVRGPVDAMGGSFHVDLAAAANAARFRSLPNLFNLAFLGLLASAGCFVAWNSACKRLGTVTATVGIYLIPAITALFAFAFLHERLTAMAAIGAVLTLLGVFLSGR